MTFTISEPFAPRPITFNGVSETRGHRLKRYVVRWAGAAFRPPDFAGGVECALASLPQPAVTAGRPGVGFLIEHQGEGANYVVLCRWANVNELPIRAWVDSGQGWAPADEDQAVCVSDLEIVWNERQLYIAQVLGDGRGDLEAYLAADAAP